VGESIKSKAENVISIVDLFKDLKPQKTTTGYKLECPSCGLQGNRTKGFILFSDGNRAYCHSSGKSFGLLEAYALKKGLIDCIDGREKGQKGAILEGDLFTKTMDELKEEYDKETYENIMDTIGIRKSVELPGDGILDSEFADTVSERIKNKQVMFYRPVMRAIVEIGTIQHSEGEDTYNGIIELEPHRFVTILERYYRPWAKRYTREGFITVNKSLNSAKAKIVMVSDNFRDRMPVLNRIFTVPIPIIKENELTHPKKGYDERFYSYLPYNSVEIDDNLNVEEAKEIIDKIFEEFCFRDEQSKINAIAGLLTPFLRGLYPKFTTRAPVFVYDANRERAGKDYCANITGMLYEGVALEEPPISTGEKSGNANDELRKKVFTAMMAGRKRLHFSNNKGHINSAVFEGVTTSETYSDRVLGSNKSYQLPNEIDYSLSGNLGMTMTADLMNRSVFVDLFLEDEDANARKFKNPDLHGWVDENRSKILSAFYALVVNWVEKGMPPGSLPFASFPHWSKICGGVMEAAGYGNPCVRNHSDNMIVDTATSDMKTLFEECYDKYPNQEITKQQIYDVVKDNGEIFAYLDLDSEDGKREFSKKFIKYVGRIFSKIKLKHDGNPRKPRRKYMFCNIVYSSGCTSDLHGELPILVHGGTSEGTLSSTHTIGKSDGCATSTIMYHDVPNQQKVKITPISKKTPPNVDDGFFKEEDRTAQFWEADDTKDIKKQCTEDEIYQTIKNNPGINGDEVWDKHGIGTNKFISDLYKDKKLEIKDGDRLYVIG